MTKPEHPSVTNAKRRFEQEFQALLDEVVKAKQAWHLWWAVVGKDTEQYRDLVNDYAGFFVTAKSVAFHACIVCLGIVYDTHRDTVNIYELLKRGTASDIIRKDGALKFRLELQRLKPMVAKVKTLRDKAFAHRQEKLTSDQAFELAAITPFQIRDLINDTWQLLSSISVHVWRNSHHMSDFAGTDAVHLFEALRRLQQFDREEEERLWRPLPVTEASDPLSS